MEGSLIARPKGRRLKTICKTIEKDLPANDAYKNS